jgi:hypothetical protein
LLQKIVPVVVLPSPADNARHDERESPSKGVPAVRAGPGGQCPSPPAPHACIMVYLAALAGVGRVLVARMAAWAMAPVIGPGQPKDLPVTVCSLFFFCSQPAESRPVHTHATKSPSPPLLLSPRPCNLGWLMGART